MDFAMLKQMKEQSSQLTSNRQGQSEEAYEEALTYLAKAQQSGFEDKEALKEASRLLIRSIQFGRQNVDAHVAMGYLLILLGDTIQAVRYLNEARRLDPQHEDAQALIEHLKQPAERETPAYQQEMKEVSDELSEGLDELYEKTVKAIYEQSEAVAYIKWQPALSPSMFREHEEAFQAIEKTLQLAEENFMELELEMNVQTLRQKLQPLEQAKTKLERLRQMSGQLLRVVSEMKKLADEAEQATLEITLGKADLDAMEDKLDHYLDECDRYADMLDEVEGQGYSISELEKSYSSLVSNVEKLQDALDA